MAKKRKSDASRLDEVDRTMHAVFCSAANSLSQLYTQSMNHQRLSFRAGERHALEKLYQWILKQEEGSKVTTADVVAYLQNEIEYGSEEPSTSPRVPFQHQQPGLSDHQTKNSAFSNVVSSSVNRATLQPYHMLPDSFQLDALMPSEFGPRNVDMHLPNWDLTSPSNDSMDMHADSPPANGFSH